MKRATILAICRFARLTDDKGRELLLHTLQESAGAAKDTPAGLVTDARCMAARLRQMAAEPRTADPEVQARLREAADALDRVPYPEDDANAGRVLWRGPSACATCSTSAPHCLPCHRSEHEQCTGTIAEGPEGGRFRCECVICKPSRARETTRAKCGARSGSLGYRCERERGHKGVHVGYTATHKPKTW